MSSQPLAAHLTKHIPLLHYPFAGSLFALSQLSNGHSNGTALWLGGQCLAMYLAQMHAKFRPSHLTRLPRVIELGSGIGLTALSLSSLGWDVLATDIPHVITSVLEKNIKNEGIRVTGIDWSRRLGRLRISCDVFPASWGVGRPSRHLAIAKLVP
ncbi:hypothetical protein D9613_002958 [Agrocybe pediades]|uniref:Uncharacterized protein n=1 Tax=Agrocybe pediades TaxID=84607 RepID=A0A8H4QR07_9AGAR|nr:hypothetical protein D9613_002958 [Agrocybe pediades]